jgi:hypothetical protein
MLYTKIFSPKYRENRNVIILILYLAFTFLMTSCYSLKEQSVSPGELKNIEDYTVLDLKTKNGSQIHLEDYEVIIDSITKVGKGILRYERIDTVFTEKSHTKGYRLFRNKNEIMLDSISYLKIEVPEYNTLIGILIGSVVAVAIYYLTVSIIITN